MGLTYKPGTTGPVTRPFSFPSSPPTVYVAGQNAESYPDTGQPPSGIASLTVPVTLNAPGDWMIAIITWRLPGYGTPASVSVEDPAHNYWDPIAPNADSSASGLTRCAVWIAPAARVPLFPVTIAPTGFVLAMACTILGVSASFISRWVSVAGFAVATANASSSLGSISYPPAPPSQALIVTGLGLDTTSLTVTGPGTGWTSEPLVTSSLGGGDSSSDISLACAWQSGTGTPSALWGVASGTADLSGIIAGLFLTAPAPAQPNPRWPVTYHELAIGSGSGTPPSQMTWTQVPNRVLASDLRQGRQYTLGQLQAGQGTITFDNPDLALTPPGSGVFAGIDSGTPYRQRLVLPWSVTPYYVTMAGFMQRWPPSWDPGMLRGQTVATLTDAWGYANKTLRPIYLAEVLYDAPVLYCPCGDGAGSQAASDLAPGGVPMLVTQSKYGAGAATQAFGTSPPTQMLGAVSTVNPSTSARASSGGGMWSITGAQTGSIGGSFQGYSLEAVSGSFPPLSGGVTVEAWFQIIPPYPTIAGLLTIATTKDAILNVYADNTHGGNILIQDPGHALITASSANYLTGTSPLTHLVLRFTRTTVDVFVNGVATVTGASFSAQAPPGFTRLFANGAVGFSQFFNTLPNFNGFIGHLAVYQGILPAGRILSHYFAGAQGCAGESASVRVERLLQAAGLTGRRCILRDTAFQGLIPVVSAQDIGGQPASAALTNIAASTTPAVLSVAPTGAPCYLPVQDAYNQPITWTLGDNAAAGEIPFLPDFAPDYDPVKVVNDVALTQLDDQTVNVPALPGGQGASVTQYGQQTYAATGYLQGDVLSSLLSPAGLQELANWIAAVNSKPRMRIGQVTVQAAASAQSQLAWAFWAGAAVGDIVLCNLRPPTNSGQLFSVLGRITQTQRHRAFSQDETTAVITCVLDTCPEENILTADDPVRGQLNGLNVLGY